MHGIGLEVLGVFLLISLKCVEPLVVFKMGVNVEYGALRTATQLDHSPVQQGSKQHHGKKALC